MKIETFVLPGHASSSLHHRSDETGLEEGMLLSLYVQARCYFGFVKNLIDKQSQKEDLISTVRNQSQIGFKFSTLAKLKVLQISQLRHVLLLLSNLISCLKDLNWWRFVCSKHTIAIQKKNEQNFDIRAKTEKSVYRIVCISYIVTLGKWKTWFYFW